MGYSKRGGDNLANRTRQSDRQPSLTRFDVKEVTRDFDDEKNIRVFIYSGVAAKEDPTRSQFPDMIFILS